MKFKTAICERTGHEILLTDGFFVANPVTGEWSFVSVDAPDQSTDYNVAASEIVKSPEALVDWIAHLNEKTWFDAKKFADFFSRFREENKLFGSL